MSCATAAGSKAGLGTAFCSGCSETCAYKKKGAVISGAAWPALTGNCRSTTARQGPPFDLSLRRRLPTAHMLPRLSGGRLAETLRGSSAQKHAQRALRAVPSEASSRASRFATRPGRRQRTAGPPPARPRPQQEHCCFREAALHPPPSHHPAAGPSATAPSWRPRCPSQPARGPSHRERWHRLSQLLSASPPPAAAPHRPGPVRRAWPAGGARVWLGERAPGGASGGKRRYRPSLLLPCTRPPAPRAATPRAGPGRVAGRRGGPAGRVLRTGGVWLARGGGGVVAVRPGRVPGTSLTIK